MPDEPRPLRSGRYYSEPELAAAALAAVHRVVGFGRPYATQNALAAALGISGPALSAALALADPARKTPKYDRGVPVRRLILRRLPPGFIVDTEPRWTGETDPSDLLPEAEG